jgi:hypothetical protein
MPVEFRYGLPPPCQGRQIISAECWVRAAGGKVLAHGVSTLRVLHSS